MLFSPAETANLRMSQRRDQIHALLMDWGRKNPQWHSILDVFKKPTALWTPDEVSAIFTLTMLACHDLGRDLSTESIEKAKNGDA